MNHGALPPRSHMGDCKIPAVVICNIFYGDIENHTLPMLNTEIMTV